MAIEPVKIPQNVYIEDRIVGPLSLRQIIIMTLGAGFSYMLYAMIDKTYGQVSIPVAIAVWTPAVIAAAFAIVRINDLSLLRICMLILERMMKPSQRTFAPRTGISITFRTNKAITQEEPAKQVAEQEHTKEQIRQLSTVVDSAMGRTEVAEGTEATEGTEVASTSVPSVPSVPSETPQASEAPRPAVDPKRVKVDPPELSDLSVFRDIFPTSAPWH